MIKRMLVHEEVMAICRFRDDGTLGQGYGMLEPGDLERLARFARDYYHMLLANADQLAMFSDMPGWTPTRAWMVFGPDQAVLGYGNLACLVNGSHPPVNRLMETLHELADL